MAFNDGSDSAAMVAGVITTGLVGGLALWHVPLELALIGRYGAGEGAALAISLLLAAAVAVAFWAEPWFAGGRLDRRAYVAQNGRLIGLMLVVAIGLGIEAQPAVGPSLASLLLIGLALGLLAVVEVVAGFVVERWQALVTRAPGRI